MTRWRTLTRGQKLVVGQVGLLIVGVMAAAIAVWWSWHAGETTFNRTHFTQFWTLPQPDRRIEVGVSNREGRPLAYSVTIRANDVRLLRRHLNVSPGGTWTTMLDVPLAFKPVSVVGHLDASTGSRTTHVVIVP